MKKENQVYECNALIEDACVTIDRGCFLSVWLSLKYDGMGQGFGGYVLGGTPDCNAGKHDQQKNLAGEFLVRTMRAADVEDFSKMVGKSIRVRKTDEWGDILAIGHIVKNDRWFYPRETFDSWTEKAREEAGKEPANAH